MIKMVVEKGTAKNKKFKAIFYDSRYGDYTLTKDKEQRKKYITRHKKDLAKGNYMSAGHLSFYILWGASTDREKNIRAYKRRFKLK